MLPAVEPYKVSDANMAIMQRIFNKNLDHSSEVTTNKNANFAAPHKVKSKHENRKKSIPDNIIKISNNRKSRTNSIPNIDYHDVASPQSTSRSNDQDKDMNTNIIPEKSNKITLSSVNRSGQPRKNSRSSSIPNITTSFDTLYHPNIATTQNISQDNEDNDLNSNEISEEDTLLAYDFLSHLDTKAKLSLDMNDHPFIDMSPTNAIPVSRSKIYSDTDPTFILNSTDSYNDLYDNLYNTTTTTTTTTNIDKNNSQTMNISDAFISDSNNVMDIDNDNDNDNDDSNQLFNNLINQHHISIVNTTNNNNNNQINSGKNISRNTNKPTSTTTSTTRTTTTANTTKTTTTSALVTKGNGTSDNSNNIMNNRSITTTPNHTNNISYKKVEKDSHIAFNIYFIRKCMVRHATIHSIQEVLIKLDVLLSLIDLQSTGVILYENFIKLLLTIIPSHLQRDDIYNYLLQYASLDNLIEYKEVLYNGKIMILKMININQLFPSIKGWIMRQKHSKLSKYHTTVRAQVSWSQHCKWLNTRFIDTLRSLLTLGQQALLHTEKKYYAECYLLDIGRRYVALDYLIRIGRHECTTLNKKTLAILYLQNRGKLAVKLQQSQYKAYYYLHSLASIILVDKNKNLYQVNYDKIYRLKYIQTQAYTWLTCRGHRAVTFIEKKNKDLNRLFVLGKNSLGIIDKWVIDADFLLKKGHMAKKQQEVYNQTVIDLRVYGNKYKQHTNYQHQIFHTFLYIQGRKAINHTNKQHCIYLLYAEKLRPQYLQAYSIQYATYQYLTIQIAIKSLKLQKNQYISNKYLISKYNGYIRMEQVMYETYLILKQIGDKAKRHVAKQYEREIPYLQARCQKAQKHTTNQLNAFIYLQQIGQHAKFVTFQKLFYLAHKENEKLHKSEIKKLKILDAKNYKDRMSMVTYARCYIELYDAYMYIAALLPVPYCLKHLNKSKKMKLRRLMIQTGRRFYWETDEQLSVFPNIQGVEHILDYMEFPYISVYGFILLINQKLFLNLLQPFLSSLCKNSTLTVIDVLKVQFYEHMNQISDVEVISFYEVWTWLSPLLPIESPLDPLSSTIIRSSMKQISNNSGKLKESKDDNESDKISGIDPIMSTNNTNDVPIENKQFNTKYAKRFQTPLELIYDANSDTSNQGNTDLTTLKSQLPESDNMPKRSSFIMNMTKAFNSHQTIVATNTTTAASSSHTDIIPQFSLKVDSSSTNILLPKIKKDKSILGNTTNTSTKILYCYSDLFSLTERGYLNIYLKWRFPKGLYHNEDDSRLLCIYPNHNDSEDASEDASDDDNDEV